jgi:long-chain acyl-CoA synthetase
MACLGADLSYAELDRYSRALGARLQSLGLQPGDRVALMLPNSIVHPIAMTGVLYAGLIVVSVNPLYTARELEHQLHDSGAKAIVTSASVLPILRQISSDALPLHVICASVAELRPSGERWLPDTNAVAIPDTVTFASALAADSAALRPHTTKPADIAFLQYTGGTTGV